MVKHMKIMHGDYSSEELADFRPPGELAHYRSDSTTVEVRARK